MNVYEIFSHLDEKWSQKYKSSINCANPRGFSQRAHCAGRKKNEAIDTHKFALPAKNLSQLYAIKNKLSQTTPTPSEPAVATPASTTVAEPVKSLEQLRRERTKLDQIIDYVQRRIPALVNRAAHTKLGIPPGLAADLELDYPTPTSEAEMDEYLVFLARKEKMLADHIRRARAVFRESTNRNITNKFVKKFLPWVAKELKIKQLPDIKLLDQPMNNSFGTYDSAENCLYLVTAGRHPVDVLRTLAHELTHHKQNMAGVLDPHSGETGTEEENEANANAGIVMRNFNNQHPEYLGLQENFAGKRAGDTITQADIIRIRGDVNRLKQGNKAQRERGIRLERQLRTFLNTHRKPNPAVGADK